MWIPVCWSSFSSKILHFYLVLRQICCTLDYLVPYISRILPQSNHHISSLYSTTKRDDSSDEYELFHNLTMAWHIGYNFIWWHLVLIFPTYLYFSPIISFFPVSYPIIAHPTPFSCVHRLCHTWTHASLVTILPEVIGIYDSSPRLQYIHSSSDFLVGSTNPHICSHHHIAVSLLHQQCFHVTDRCAYEKTG